MHILSFSYIPRVRRTGPDHIRHDRAHTEYSRLQNLRRNARRRAGRLWHSQARRLRRERGPTPAAGQSWHGGPLEATRASEPGCGRRSRSWPDTTAGRALGEAERVESSIPETRRVAGGVPGKREPARGFVARRVEHRRGMVRRERDGAGDADDDR